MVRKQILIQVAVAAVVLLAAVGITCFLCKARSAPKDRPVVTGIKYEVITAADVDENFETAGTLKARTVSEVASRIIGTVTAMKVKQGDIVKAGDVLLEIDDKDLSERYKGAQAAHDEATKALDAARERQSLAETTYARYKSLSQQNAIAQQQFDEIASQKKLADSEFARAGAAVAGAESNLQDARLTLGYAKVTAPTNGVVTWRSAEVGSMAHPGEKLITVEDISQFRVDINVDERLAGMVKVGMPVNVSIESIGRKIMAEVTEVVPSVDPMSRSALACMPMSLYGPAAGKLRSSPKRRS
jgi:RND family efflux transporter MFP subunit